ncbi:MAG: SufD family Fe-S cluster assembly protein [Proteobacteria bacterium]|nr:SufD family Fe-S cluster assembly protein [Pseudomonadota bacterium]
MSRSRRLVEDWRYADQSALALLWPLPAPERIVVAPGESVTRALVHEGEGVVQLEVELGAGAVADIRVLSHGAGYGRVEVSATLGEGADFTLGAVQLCDGDAKREVVASVTHAGPDATSRQLVRSVAGGRSSASVLGRIVVDKGADGTDAEQSIRALLLARGASANARPELEIHADDVKCAHGCAVGELDEGALFYMAARGLDPATARALMLQAFIAEPFAGSTMEEQLMGAARTALGAMA